MISRNPILKRQLRLRTEKQPRMRLLRRNRSRKKRASSPWMNGKLCGIIERSLNTICERPAKVRICHVGRKCMLLRRRRKVTKKKRRKKRITTRPRNILSALAGKKRVLGIEIQFSDSRRGSGGRGRGGRGRGDRMNGRGFGNRGAPRDGDTRVSIFIEL